MDKKCSICLEIKYDDEYYRIKRKSGGVYTYPYCKVCQRRKSSISSKKKHQTRRDGIRSMSDERKESLFTALSAGECSTLRISRDFGLCYGTVIYQKHKLLTRRAREAQERGEAQIIAV